MGDHARTGGVAVLAAALVLVLPGTLARVPSDPGDAGVAASDPTEAGLVSPEPADAGAEGEAPDAGAGHPGDAGPAAPARRSVLKDAQRALGLTLQREPTLRVGPRIGGSINFDQWLMGGQILGDSIGIDALGLEAMFLVGLGGNHLTLRPAARLLYTFWIGGHRGLGIAPTVGASALIYVPVGDFASFCNRVELHGCGGWTPGMDLGGSLRFRWLRLEATVGFFGIPKGTISLAFDFPVGRPRPAEPPAGATP